MVTDGKTVEVPFNNPTAVVVGALCGATLEKGPLLDSFLREGGVTALLRLLSGSTCPLTGVYTAALVQSLLIDSRVGTLDTLGATAGRPGRPSKVCDRLLQSGEKRHRT
jgi:hypothetical protein